MKKLFLFLTLVCIWTQLSAAVWQVGPSRTYSLPSQVSAMVHDGDTVEIDAGIYAADVTRWTAHHLLIRGINGYTHLDAQGTSYGGKAIWVIQGDNTTIEGIEFSHCACDSHNGAGIRQEGHYLTVHHCLFHDNEEGILAGTVTPSTILIEFTEFDHNGYGDGFSHNLYINNIDTLIFRFNYSHHCVIGHELKSRAHVNYILYNRFSNEATGTASRETDLPNGGLAVLIGNIYEQGPNASEGNTNIIGYGLEGLSNPAPHEVYLINNTIVNDYPSGRFVDIHPSTSFYKAYNNIFAGAGTLLNGSASMMDTSHNWHTTQISSIGFINPGLYDYHLMSGSSARDAGIPPGNAANGFPLSPTSMYRHPADSAVRIPSGIIDIGAYEYSSPTDVNEETHTQQHFSVHGKALHLHSSTPVRLCVYTTAGTLVMTTTLSPGEDVDMSRIATGVYFICGYGSTTFTEEVLLH